MSQPPALWPSRDGRPAVEIIGHGGAAAYHPPNSEAGIRAAVAIGVDRIELDVLASRDDFLVLTHDATVAIGGGQARPVRSLSLADLRRHDPLLLTLDEAAEVIGDRVPLLLDAKRAGDEDALAAAILRHGWAETAAVSSTYAITLCRLRHRFPNLRLGLSTGHWASSTPTASLRIAVTAALRLAAPLPLLAALKAVAATDTMLRHEVATAPLVAALHRAGYRVNLFTVDDPPAIRRALALGADGIISNRPDLARRLAAEPAFAPDRSGPRVTDRVSRDRASLRPS